MKLVTQWGDDTSMKTNRNYIALENRRPSLVLVLMGAQRVTKAEAWSNAQESVGPPQADTHSAAKHFAARGLRCNNARVNSLILVQCKATSPSGPTEDA